MTQREKLIELLENRKPMSCIYDDEVNCDECNYKENGCFNGKLADYLIANDVVVLPCRCWECEHCDIGQNDAEQWCFCQEKRIDVDPTDFCSYGKRKGGDE